MPHAHYCRLGAMTLSRRNSSPYGNATSTVKNRNAELPPSGASLHPSDKGRVTLVQKPSTLSYFANSHNPYFSIVVQQKRLVCDPAHNMVEGLSFRLDSCYSGHFDIPFRSVGTQSSRQKVRYQITGIEMSDQCQKNVKVMSKCFDTILTIQPRLTVPTPSSPEFPVWRKHFIIDRIL